MDDFLRRRELPFVSAQLSELVREDSVLRFKEHLVLIALFLVALSVFLDPLPTDVVVIIDRPFFFHFGSHVVVVEGFVLVSVFVSSVEEIIFIESAASLFREEFKPYIIYATQLRDGLAVPEVVVAIGIFDPGGKERPRAPVFDFDEHLSIFIVLGENPRVPMADATDIAALPFAFLQVADDSIYFVRVFGGRDAYHFLVNINERAASDEPPQKVDHVLLLPAYARGV